MAPATPIMQVSCSSRKAGRKGFLASYHRSAANQMAALVDTNHQARSLNMPFFGVSLTVADCGYGIHKVLKNINIWVEENGISASIRTSNFRFIVHNICGFIYFAYCRSFQSTNTKLHKVFHYAIYIAMASCSFNQQDKT